MSSLLDLKLDVRPMIRPLRQSHPRVDVSIDVASTPNAVKALLDAKIELAIVGSNRKLPPYVDAFVTLLAHRSNLGLEAQP